MEGGNWHGVRRRLAFAGRRLVLVFVCLVLAPIGGIWVGAQLPNPPGNGPGVWQIVFGLGVPAGVALVAVAAMQVRRLEAALWVIAALLGTLGLLLLIAYLVAQVD